MGLKFEVSPQMKLGTKVENGSLEIVVQNGEEQTLQTIASVTDKGLTVHRLAHSHRDTPQKIGFEDGAFDENRTIKVLEEGSFSNPRSRTGDSVKTTFRCRTGDGDFVQVRGGIHKGITIVSGDGTGVLLGIEEAIAFRDTIDHFIRKAKED